MRFVVSLAFYEQGDIICRYILTQHINYYKLEDKDSRIIKGFLKWKNQSFVLT